MARKASFLFLDFDGVVCDSLEECYQSSWLTDHAPEIGEEVPIPAPTEPAYRIAFRACRPFVRSGEDYVALHRLIAAGQAPESQTAFDLELEAIGRMELDAIKSKLYAVREALLIKHRALWLGWNPLYPGMRSALTGLVRNGNVLILSTKKADFIAQILTFHKIAWPIPRIIYSGSERKLAIIERIAGDRTSVLIDDQIDHLDFDHPTCDCRAALWGYVAKGSLTEHTPTLTLSKALELIRSFEADH